ncbi:MAG TPA: hypothetical protein VF096_06145 [Azonexus sp.]
MLVSLFERKTSFQHRTREVLPGSRDSGDLHGGFAAVTGLLM